MPRCLETRLPSCKFGGKATKLTAWRLFTELSVELQSYVTLDSFKLSQICRYIMNFLSVETDPTGREG